MARSRNSSSKRTADTDLADEYLLGGPIVPEPEPVECPACTRGRVEDNRCNRCGVMIPSSGTLKNHAWREEE